MEPVVLLRSIRRWILFFIAALLVSGLTAFAIETELRFLLHIFPAGRSLVSQWLLRVYEAVRDTNARFPFISYGSDWLAFAHIVIAMAFIGPLRDPVRNKWVILFGQIACVMIVPLAFIAGPIREIPLFWRLVDCSFGVLGFIPLTICAHKIRQLENQLHAGENPAMQLDSTPNTFYPELFKQKA